MADLRCQRSSFCTLFSVSISFLLCFQVVPCQAQVEEGKIRIDPGPREGVVEVFLDEQWGTISNDNLDENTPTVICRQQGFNGPVEKMDGTVYKGPLNSPVWIINNCPETASSILDCEMSEAESTITDLSEYSENSVTFDHDNDLGIICREPTVQTLPFIIIDIILFVVAILFIILFAYMAYRFSKKKSTERDDRRDPSSNPDYQRAEETQLQEVRGEENAGYSEYSTVR